MARTIAQPDPLTPRLLKPEQAAAYCGGIPIAAFKRLRLGEIHLGTRVLYDRHALDAHLDQLAGLAPQSPPAIPRADNDDPEAAFDRSAPDLAHAPRRP